MPLYNPAVELTEASVNAALDTPWITDTSITTFSDLFGGTVNLGTGSEIILVYKRMGRSVQMHIYFKIGASPTWGNGGPLFIPVASLPIIPQAPPATAAYAAPGGFGYLSDGTIPGTELVAPALVQVGAPDPILAFITQPGDGNIGNLVTRTNPLPMVEGTTYQGYMVYYADTAL